MKAFNDRIELVEPGTIRRNRYGEEIPSPGKAHTRPCWYEDGAGDASLAAGEQFVQGAAQVRYIQRRRAHLRQDRAIQPTWTAKLDGGVWDIIDVRHVGRGRTTEVELVRGLKHEST